MLRLDERAYRHALERGDPAQTIGLSHVIDRLPGDHAAIPHHHHLLDAEVLAQARHLGHKSLAVAHIALMHRDGNGTAPRIGEQAVVDL